MIKKLSKMSKKIVKSESFMDPHKKIVVRLKKEEEIDKRVLQKLYYLDIGRNVLWKRNKH